MIHVVDDEEPIRDALAWLLRSRDLACRTYASAEEFLAFVAWESRDPHQSSERSLPASFPQQYLYTALQQ